MQPRCSSPWARGNSSDNDSPEHTRQAGRHDQVDLAVGTILDNILEAAKAQGNAASSSSSASGKLDGQDNAAKSQGGKAAGSGDQAAAKGRHKSGTGAPASDKPSFVFSGTCWNCKETGHKPPRAWRCAVRSRPRSQAAPRCTLQGCHLGDVPRRERDILLELVHQHVGRQTQVAHVLGRGAAPARPSSRARTAGRSSSWPDASTSLTRLCLLPLSSLSRTQQPRRLMLHWRTRAACCLRRRYAAVCGTCGCARLMAVQVCTAARAGVARAWGHGGRARVA